MDWAPPRGFAGNRNDPGRDENLAAFCRSTGTVSVDGAGQNSFFVEGLKESLARPDRPLIELFRNVSAYVRTVTRGEQVPQIVSDWTTDIALGSRSAARIDYDIIGSDSEKPLTSDERDLVVRSATGFSEIFWRFHRQGKPRRYTSRRPFRTGPDQGQAVSQCCWVSIRTTLSGTEYVTLHLFFRQTRYVLVIEKEGVRAEVDNCLDGKEAKNVEIALRDLNGDRRPEVWMAFETEDTLGWGTFCILEYKGVPDLSTKRRDNTGQVYASYAAFRTLLRDNAGWRVSIATDNTIEACGGSGCGYRHRYRFDGERFVMTDMDGSPPQGAAALPFRDDQDHASNLFAAYSRASQPLSSQPWTVSLDAKTNKITVETKVGTHTKFGFECQRNGEAVFEQLFVRDVAISPPLNSPWMKLWLMEKNPLAPIRIEDVNCGLDSMELEQNGGIVMAISKETADRCLSLIDRAKFITFPVLFREKSLLQARLPAGQQAIASARTACQKVTHVRCTHRTPHARGSRCVRWTASSGGRFRGPSPDPPFHLAELPHRRFDCGRDRGNLCG